MNEIKLYADEFDVDVWESYCEICKVPYSATVIIIKFRDKNVDYQE